MIDQVYKEMLPVMQKRRVQGIVYVTRSTTPVR